MTATYNKMPNFSNPSCPPHHLIDIINSDPILSEYFRVNCSQNRYSYMAHELMLDGIRYRTNIRICDRQCCCNEVTNIKKKDQIKNIKIERIPNKIEEDKIINLPNQTKNISNQKNKHYNVAYVKHNRFLSPKQKKQNVTPKITETVPVKSQPLIIYGKPRVKVHNQCGCPYHNNQQQCLSTPYGGTCQPKTPRKNIQHQVHIRQNTDTNFNDKDNYQANQTKKYKELSKYKSTPNLINDFNRRQLDQQLDKTQKNNKIKQKKQKKVINNIVNDIPGQTIYVDKILQIQSRIPAKMHHLQSPQSRVIKVQSYQQQNSQDQKSYLISKYNQRQLSNQKNIKKQIESKIKFLIDRDKKNKAMQKYIKDQEQRIKNLQKIMKSEKKQKPKIKVSSDILSLSSSSSSGMTSLNSNIIDKFKKGNRQHAGLQSKQDSNQKNSARFGVKEQSLNANLEDQFQQDCQCSKTLNNDEQSQSQINTDLKQSGQSGSFSDFNG